MSTFKFLFFFLEHRNGWVIQTATKSFAVYAATSVEKEEWVAHINKCVGDLLRKSGKKASETHAAVWIPDTEADVCMHCKKTQFTLLTRRVSFSNFFYTSTVTKSLL